MADVESTLVARAISAGEPLLAELTVHEDRWELSWDPIDDDRGGDWDRSDRKTGSPWTGDDHESGGGIRRLGTPGRPDLKYAGRHRIAGSVGRPAFQDWLAAIVTTRSLLHRRESPIGDPD